MKRILLSLCAITLLSAVVCAQVLSVTAELYYTDDSSVQGYPADHSTYRIYANCTNATDRVTAVSGNGSAPLVLNVTGGVWNHPAGGVLGNAANCAIFSTAELEAAEYDSYVTLDYACNSGSSGNVYSAEDSNQPWKTAVFNTMPYGNSNMLINSNIGGGWLGVINAVNSDTDNTLAGADLKVFIAQITLPNSGSICGIFNVQCFPNYQSPTDDYILQTGFEFGTTACGVGGCTDPLALNYNADADFDNGICLDTCALAFDMVSSVGPTCDNGADGYIYFNGIGSQGSILYSFDNVAIGLIPDTIFDLSNGMYMLTISDTRFDNEEYNPAGIYGTCTVTQQVELMTEPIAIGDLTTTAVSCNGAADGCAEAAVVEGGTEPFVYNIYFIEGSPVMAGENQPLELDMPSYCGLGGGIYYFVATDANGCVGQSTFFEIVELPAISVTETTEVPSSCFNSLDGSQAFDISGGNGVLSFEIDGNGDYEIPQGDGSVVIENISSGNYILYARDESGCEVSLEFSVSGGPAIEATFEVTNQLCFGGNSGTIIVTATGGTGALMYSIDGDVYSGNNEFMNLPAGLTTVYIMDENFCVLESEVEITEPTMLEATAEATPVSCAGYTNGTLLITATGGTEIYAFSIDGINYTPSPLFFDLSVGTYSIYVEDANGCVFEMTNAAEVTEPIALTATGEATAETCFDANDGQIIIDAQGGTAPYTYSIDDVEYNNSPIGDLEAGTYDVHIIDNNGCEVEVMSLVVTQPDALVINNLTPNSIDEDAGGNNTYTVTGGTAPYEFEWTYNGNVVSTNQDLDDLTDAAQQGDYTLEVTDDNGCTATQQISITDIDELTASNSVSMFPNPNNGLFQINILAIKSAKMSYTLADETGRIALAKELGNVAGTRTENIDATQCAKGIYYLSIRMGDVTHISKLIIQ
jgi:SprB repeat/Secretion system C-terminal sorting domain